jgi:Holliday junction resolvase RusA-like endonuclease
VLKGLPTGGNSRQSWRAKYAETTKWKKAVFFATRNKLPSKPLKKVRLKFTRFSTSKMDWDNLVISFKAIQDGLVDCGVMRDDKVKNIPEIPVYAQGMAKRGEGKVKIEVWEI